MNKRESQPRPEQTTTQAEYESVKSEIGVLRTVHDMFEDRTTLSPDKIRPIAKQFTRAGIEVFKDLADALVQAKEELG